MTRARETSPPILPAFRRLWARVTPLGNIRRKYLWAVERHGERLVACLEAAGRLTNVHLDRVAPSLSEDFEHVAAAGADAEEKLVLLGTFFALQFLHQNARALEQLAFDLAEEHDRARAYTDFVVHIEEEFSALISTYVRHVCRIILPPDHGPFAILSVGTRGHQDDIDVAVIDEDGEDRPALERAVSALAGQCLRYASPFDNYVAGEAGARGFFLSVQELRRALRSGRLGCVVVTELLRAELLAGDPSYLRRLREEVTSEYMFRPGRDNSRHELYLRALLGETRSLLLHPPPEDRVNPKDDALRLILGLATAFKTIEGLGATQPGELLADLIARRPDLASGFSTLQQSRVFMEAFRHVCQLLISQQEEVPVEGAAAREDLTQVAAAMGYHDWGPVQAVHRLLVRYHEAVDAAQGAAVGMMDEVARHLTEISRFARWRRGAPPEEFASELAGELSAATREFRGVRFYDDLLEALGAPDGKLMAAFLSSFVRLPEAERRELARHYAELGSDTPYALLTFLTLLARHAAERRLPDPGVEIAAAFASRLEGVPEAVRALSRVFRFYPDLANRFLFTLEPGTLDRLHTVIEVPIGNPEVAAARDHFRDLISVHIQSSRYVKRVLARVTSRFPATVQAISDDATLRTLALGRLAASERHPSIEEQKGLLGDFYDLEFLRIAMGTLRGEPDSITRAAFADLTSTYLTRLFDVCFRETDIKTGLRRPARDRIGILLSGGNARGRPYDDDYDLIVVVEPRDPAERTFTERVVSLMNRQVARRGVIAQYRLAEWFGKFACTLDELDELLCRDEDDLFVDRCQLLGSRMVVGTRRLEEHLLERVLQPHVFDKADEFVARVEREIADRRRSFRASPSRTHHIKEDPGGLRDADLCLAIAKARLGYWDLPGADACEEIVRRDTERSSLYQRLRTCYDFLVAVRSAYRVAVAATDEVEEAYLSAPARILGLQDWDGTTAGPILFAEIGRRLEESAAIVDELTGTAASP